MISPDTMISTRRFRLQRAAVSLESIGLVVPKPRDTILSD